LYLEQWIPSQLARIHDVAVSELKAWLDLVRGCSEKVGKVEDSSIQSIFEEYTTHCKQSVSDSKASTAAPFEVVLLERLGDKALFESKEIKQTQLSFDRLLKAAHLFELMDRSDAFKDFLAENFKVQSGSLTKFSAGDEKSVEDLLKYFHRILGFLLIESHVKQLLPSLYTSDMTMTISMFIRTAQKSVKSLLDDSSCDLDTMLILNAAISRITYSVKLRFGIESSLFGTLPSLNMDVFHKYHEVLLTKYQEKSFILCGEGKVDLFADLLLQFVNEYFAGLSGLPINVSEMFDICKKLVTDNLIDCCLLQNVYESNDIRRLNQVDYILSFIPRIEDALALQACLFNVNCSHKMNVKNKVEQCRTRLERSLLSTYKHDVNEMFSRHIGSIVYLPDAKKSVAGSLIKDTIEFIANCNENAWSELDQESSQLLKLSIVRYINCKLVDLLEKESFNSFFVESFADEIVVMAQYVSKLNPKYSDCFAEIYEVLKSDAQ
jgi:hypothetical protein